MRELASFSYFLAVNSRDIYKHKFNVLLKLSKQHLYTNTKYVLKRQIMSKARARKKALRGEIQLKAKPACSLVVGYCHGKK